MAEKLFCNEFDPTPGGAAYMYDFAQKDGESVAEAAVRAAEIVINTGINEEGPYVGTNHVAANNAAFAFSDDLLAQLKEDEGSSAQVVAAAELLEARKAQVSANSVAEDLDKVAGERQAEGKGLAFAFAKSAANKSRAEADASLQTMRRIKPLVLAA